MGRQYKTINLYGKLFDGARITPAITRAAETARVFGLTLVKSKTPVRTGRLKSGWKANSSGHGIRWSNETPYGIFVEMGTRRMAARNMLSSSLPEIEKSFKKALAKEIGTKLAAKIIAKVSGDAGSYEALTSGTPTGLIGGFKDK
jgi:hypothetical protein